MYEALFIQRGLKLLFKTGQLPLIHHQKMHSNLEQEMKNNVSQWRYKVKSTWQKTYEWDPGQNYIIGNHMLKLMRESAMGSSFPIKGKSPVLHLTALTHAFRTAAKENKSNLRIAISKAFKAKKGQYEFFLSLLSCRKTILKFSVHCAILYRKPNPFWNQYEL